MITVSMSGLTGQIALGAKIGGDQTLPHISRVTSPGILLVPFHLPQYPADFGDIRAPCNGITNDRVQVSKATPAGWSKMLKRAEAAFYPCF